MKKFAKWQHALIICFHLKFMSSNQFWTRRSYRPQSGETYGPYRIEELIVETKFSILYSSTFLQDGSKKAIKFIKCLKGKEERVKNEVEIMKRIDHPNLLKLEYSSIRDPYMIIVTNYAPFENLSRFMGKYYPSGMPSRIAQYVLLQMVSAIAYLHNLGIWHRDIKPQNFLVFNNDKDKPYVVLADFGLAKQYQKCETDNSLAGTKKYMAPEIINNQRYTNAVDIWALGVTFFFMMTNQEAFETPSSDSMTRENEKIEKMIKNGYLNYDLINEQKDLPEIIGLIKRMCEVIPSKRITAKELQKHPWLVGNSKNGEERAISSLVGMGYSDEFDDAIPSV